MPHHRSKRALGKRLARRIVLATSYYDREQAENVSLVTLSYADRIEDFEFTVSVERGEILSDKRCRGTLQQIKRVEVNVPWRTLKN